jgi:hypothetical protein
MVLKWAVFVKFLRDRREPKIVGLVPHEDLENIDRRQGAGTLHNFQGEQ